MKRIGTVLLLLFLVASSSKGQVTHTVNHPTVPYSKAPSLIVPSNLHFLHPMKVETALADTTIAYFDPDSTGNFNWYSLPSHLTLNSGTPANPLDTQYVINRYAERFTLPKKGLWITRYVDSVEFLFAPLTLPTDGTTDSLILEVRPGVDLFYPNLPGDTLFGYSTIGKPLDSVIVTTDNLVQDQVYDTVFHLNYRLPATVLSDFFIVLYTPDTDLTRSQFFIRGDSVTVPTPLESPLTSADQDLYRGMWAVYDPTSYPYHENDYAGLQFTNQDNTQTDYFYSNFVIVVHMSNQLTNAVDATGKPQFVLEQNFPNPVSSSTEIDYNLASAAPVLLTVYNQLGQQVATAANSVQSAGEHSTTFNAGTLPNGMYYYKLQSGDFTATRTMVINR
ncbi:MAG: T9SS type A sorting domain-containing protein [Candidatus Kapaibacterium sp.]